MAAETVMHGSMAEAAIINRGKTVNLERYIFWFFMGIDLTTVSHRRSALVYNISTKIDNSFSLGT